MTSTPAAADGSQADRRACLERLRGGVIVSVQAQSHEPFYADAPFCALAQSVLDGGALGLRLAGARHIALMRAAHPDLTIIGLSKPDPIPADARDRVYITPGFADVAELARAGASIVALDATDRPRPEGETVSDIVARARQCFPALGLMADCACMADVRRANVLGFDLISTTLSGYTNATQARDNGAPDFDLLREAVAAAGAPVACEGRLWEPSQVAEAFALGACCVVIGSALTRPHLATRRFVNASPLGAV
ncbi:MAG: putative N-acetylmannosamine-6-phosphate 2-epimerase [Vampirovibrionales bacterium]|nr:putative N-acetylmannosamine-6-phosphate 2-epimerase [Vampirovibrionales bacterium]